MTQIPFAKFCQINLEQNTDLKCGKFYYLFVFQNKIINSATWSCEIIIFTSKNFVNFYL